MVEYTSVHGDYSFSFLSSPPQSGQSLHLPSSKCVVVRNITLPLASEIQPRHRMQTILTDTSPPTRSDDQTFFPLSSTICAPTLTLSVIIIIVSEMCHYSLSSMLVYYTMLECWLTLSYHNYARMLVNLLHTTS